MCLGVVKAIFLTVVSEYHLDNQPDVLPIEASSMFRARRTLDIQWKCLQSPLMSISNFIFNVLETHHTKASTVSQQYNYTLRLHHEKSTKMSENANTGTYTVILFYVISPEHYGRDEQLPQYIRFVAHRQATILIDYPTPLHYYQNGNNIIFKFLDRQPSSWLE